MEKTTKFLGAPARFIKGAVPLFAILLILLAFSQNSGSSMFCTACVFALCALILWFGWNWIRQNLITKWVAIVLAVHLAFVLAMMVLGIALGLGMLLMVLFLAATPFLIYDLFFRSPYKGRFSRMRAERRHLRS